MPSVAGEPGKNLLASRFPAKLSSIRCARERNSFRMMCKCVWRTGKATTAATAAEGASGALCLLELPIENVLSPMSFL